MTVVSTPIPMQLQDVLCAQRILIAQQAKLARTTHVSPSALRIQTALTPRLATPLLATVKM